MGQLIGYIGQIYEAQYIILNSLQRIKKGMCDTLHIVYPKDGEIVYLENQGATEALYKVRHQQPFVSLGYSYDIEEAYFHRSMNGRIFVAIQGILTNEQKLQEKYGPLGDFIVQFIEEGHSTEEAVRRVGYLLEGQVALFVIDALHPDTLFIAQLGKVLHVGKGKNGYLIATEAQVLSDEIEHIFVLREEEFAVVRPENCTVTNLDGTERDPLTHFRESRLNEQHQDAIEDRMFQYMHEQPSVLCHLVRTYTEPNGQMNFDEHLMDALVAAKRLYIVASRSSYYASLVAKRQFEQLAATPVEVFRTTEFTYAPPLLEEQSVVLFVIPKEEAIVAQEAVDEMRRRNIPVGVMTNEMENHPIQNAQWMLSTETGIEFAMTTTKTYFGFIALFAMLAVALGERKEGKMPMNIPKQFAVCSQSIFQILQQKMKMNEFANIFIDRPNAFIVGSGLDHAVSLKVALMLKELTLVQAESYASGELRYGPVQFIEEGTPVFVLTTNQRTDSLVRRHAEALRQRKANIFIVSSEETAQQGDAIVLPTVHPLLTPLISILPFELISYFAARTYGVNVDHPL